MDISAAEIYIYRICRPCERPFDMPPFPPADAAAAAMRARRGFAVTAGRRSMRTCAQIAQAAYRRRRIYAQLISADAPLFQAGRRRPPPYNASHALAPRAALIAFPRIRYFVDPKLDMSTLHTDGRRCIYCRRDIAPPRRDDMFASDRSRCTYITFDA